jgi:hypothetical protein
MNRGPRFRRTGRRLLAGPAAHDSGTAGMVGIGGMGGMAGMERRAQSASSVNGSPAISRERASRYSAFGPKYVYFSKYWNISAISCAPG